MRKRIRKKIVLVLVGVAIQGIVFFVCYFSSKQIAVRKYEVLLEEQNIIMEAACRRVYITRKEVKRGEVFTEENTEQRYLLSEQNPDALAVEVIGTKACADLPAGVILNTVLCYKPECAPSERQCVFQNIGFAECFPSYTVVDVRIRYANGENYCVLKKKQLRKAEDDEEVCSFFLSEEEQLLMSAAQYDVDVYDGAELYLVGFMEERLQEDSVSDYLPSVQVMSQLCEWNGLYANFYESRRVLRIELEQRLAEHRRKYVEGLI